MRGPACWPPPHRLQTPRPVPEPTLLRRRSPCIGRGATDGSDAPALGRAAAVVRNRRDVPDRQDLEADGLQRAQCGLTAGAGTLDLDLEGAHAVLLGLAAGRLGGQLGGVGSRLARPLEALAAG